MSAFGRKYPKPKQSRASWVARADLSYLQQQRPGPDKSNLLEEFEGQITYWEKLADDQKEQQGDGS